MGRDTAATLCPDEDTLLALASGQLAATAREPLLSHLDSCEPCRKAVASLQGGEPEGDLRARIDRYELIRPLGAGAMGVVFEAHDPELDRRVALKLLRREHGGDPARLEQRLVAEARALARLAHPNVIAAFEIGHHEGEVYLALEKVDGGTLTRWLGAQPRRTPEILAMFLQAGEGLAASHRAGLVHRDFKPDNVLVDDRGRARVTDFGLATGLVDEQAHGVDGDLAMTRTGALAGTPLYMALEQLEGGQATAKSDQFAFAVALWHALYGAFPHRGATLAELAEARRSAPHHARGRRVPAGVRKALARSLAPSPDQRHASMDALLAQLRPYASPAHRRRAVWGAAAAALAAALVVAVGGAVRRHGAVSRCDDAATLFGDTWSPARREALRVALSATPIGGRVHDLVATRLDTFEGGWIRKRDAACTATFVDHVASAETYERTATCLELQRRQTAALVAELAKTSPERALQAAGSIPDPDECGASAQPGLPVDPVLRARAVALEGELADAAALRAAGKYDAALTAIESVLARTGDAAFGHTRLHALVQRATTRIATSGPDVRRAEFETASELALQLGDDAALADALTGIADTSALLGDLSQTQLAAGLARPLLDRVPGRARRSARIALALCTAYTYALQQPDEAWRVCLAARDEAAAVDPDSATALASVDSLLGMIATRRGRGDEAIARYRAAAERVRAVYGPDHLSVVANVDNEAEALAETGRLDEAERLSLDCVTRAPQYANLWDTLATVRRKQGNLAGAIDAARRGVATCNVQGPAWCRILELTAAEIAFDAGHVDEARAGLDRAEAVAVAPDPEISGRLHYARARLARARHQPQQAAIEVDAALAALLQSGIPDSDSASPIVRLRREITRFRDASPGP